MFRNTAPDAEVAPAGATPPDEPIPPSHLELDLPVPTIGWLAYLGNVGIEILTDDVGARRFLALMPGCLSLSTTTMRFGRLSCVLRLRSGQLSRIKLSVHRWVTV
jgi:hypothetical protein